MSITHNATINPLITAVLYAGDNIIDQIAKAAIIDMASASDEMMGDYPELYQTKDAIEAGFDHLRDQAADLIQDMVAQLHISLLQRLQEIKFTARIRNIEYDDNGNVVDAKVNIKFD